MKKGILIVLLFCVFISCKRDTDKSKFGPEVIISPADFTVSGFSINPANSVDLANEDAYFSCTMPQKAEFKITISGLSSGAVKIVSGTGEYIDMSNSTWTGDSDNLSIFRNGENCVVTLEFRGAIQKYYDTIAITGANEYPNTLRINDFEGITFDKNGPNQAGYGNYFDGPDLAQTDIRTDNTLPACQGTQSVLFDGKDVNNSFYVGGMYFFPPVAPYPFITTNPDSLYLNAYVYSYGDNNTTLIFAFTEDENNDNIGDAATEDTWTKEVTVDGNGWYLVSMKLGDFTDEKAAVGNGVLNLDKITGFNVNIKSRKAGGYIKANVDYITVSYFRPFQP